MAELFDIANLITNVGVDAVKIKPEPGLPEKSSNEILTELFSTFDVPSDDDSDNNEDDEADAEADAEADEKHEEAAKEQGQPDTQDEVKVKKEKDESKKKKAKKKHKHKNDSKDKDKERKHKHKKKSKHSSDTASDPENAGSKKKKKKKKSKRKRDSDGKTSDANEPSPKKKKVDESSKDITTQDGTDKDENSKTKSPEAIKIKEEKIDDPMEKPESPKLKEASPALPPISKILDDDFEALEVPKLLEKTKNPPVQKIMIKDLKNSEVYNNAVKEVENKKKEKAERMEDGEISDSDDDENRTPTLSPTPPPDQHSSMHSDRKKRSSPTSKHITKKNDLRLVLKEREKKKQTGDRSRSQSDRRNSRGRRRSKDTNDGRSQSRHSRDRKTRSRSGDKSRRGRSRSRSRERRNRRHSDSRSDKFNHNEDRNIGRRRGRSRSRERKERIEIDKKKLLEIARKNAINLIMKGKLPLAQQDKAIAAIQAGGKSIEELTDFCKNLSKSEAMGELSSISSGDESNSEKGFHHPFLLKERPSSIIMNIRDSRQLPTRTLQEKTAEGSTQLRIQYPVSSGQQHRKNEKEWIPVPPKKTTHKNKPEPKKLFIPAKEILQNIPMPLVVPPYAETMQQTAHSMVPVAAVQPLLPVEYPFQQQPVAAGVQSEPQQSIFPVPSTEPIDISAIVSQRLAAMRKLTENPNDVQALNQMYKAQSGMQNWIESKQIPGQFTGSTGAKVLTPAELNSGHQAWARKDQLLTAQPVSGGMGMALLQKMGWKPGEGLGKNKEGTLEPLKLEVKLDKRGLVSDQDIGAARLGKVPKHHPTAPTVKTLEGKHPVSLLGEFCSKHKYGAPVYELCFECGPDHKKNFLFKVRVNDIEYKPAVASPNKKLAKAEAAQVCLQELGLLPANFSLNQNS